MERAVKVKFTVSVVRKFVYLHNFLFNDLLNLELQIY